jgi:predicted Zn-dependent protease
MDPSQLITAVPLLGALVAALVILLRELRKGNEGCTQQLALVNGKLEEIEKRLDHIERTIEYRRGREDEADRSGGYGAMPRRPQ